MPSLDVTPYNIFLACAGLVAVCALPIVGSLLLLFLPVIMLTLPLFLLPAAGLYLLYYLFYPVTPKKSPLRSIPVGEAKPGEGQPRRWATHPELVTRWADGIDTIPALLAASCEKFASRRALGVRRTVKVEEKTVKVKQDGKEVEKKHVTPWQTDYEWRTYAALLDEVRRFGSGLVSLKLQFGQRVALFAGTRPEWQIAAQACFLHGLPVVTVYPSLGVDALVYSLNQASVQHIITQADKLDIVIQTAALVPSLQYVVFFDSLDGSKRADYEKKSRLKFVSYAQVLTAGVAAPVNPSKPVQGKDIAVIMYTSGSTGNPKVRRDHHAPHS